MTLLIRSYCHLCDDMLAAVAPLVAEFGWAIEKIDVDGDPALAKRWGEHVPVLLIGKRELCHHRLDRAKVMAFLREGTEA